MNNKSLRTSSEDFLHRICIKKNLASNIKLTAKKDWKILIGPPCAFHVFDIKTSFSNFTTLRPFQDLPLFVHQINNNNNMKIQSCLPIKKLKKNKQKK